MARTLVVMRHAKAEQVGETDFERVLAPRGHRDAAAAGRWLETAGIRPDHALVSGAVRTRETWSHVVRGAGWDLGFDADFEPGLYAADADTALDLLRGVPEHVDTAVVLGHNPTMAYLAQLLDDGEGDLEGGNAMAMGFPTSALAVLTQAGAWVDLGPGVARLTAYHVGRG